MSLNTCDIKGNNLNTMFPPLSKKFKKGKTFFEVNLEKVLIEQSYQSKSEKDIGLSIVKEIKVNKGLVPVPRCFYLAEKNKNNEFLEELSKSEEIHLMMSLSTVRLSPSEKTFSIKLDEDSSSYIPSFEELDCIVNADPEQFKNLIGFELRASTGEEDYGVSPNKLNNVTFRASRIDTLDQAIGCLTGPQKRALSGSPKPRKSPAKIKDPNNLEGQVTTVDLTSNKKENEVKARRSKKETINKIDLGETTVEDIVKKSNVEIKKETEKTVIKNTEEKQTKNDKETIAPPKKKRGRRSKEEVLIAKIKDYKNFLEENGYSVKKNAEETPEEENKEEDIAKSLDDIATRLQHISSEVSQTIKKHRSSLDDLKNNLQASWNNLCDELLSSAAAGER